MGGSNPTQRKPRQEQKTHHVYLETDHLKKLHHELQKGRELSEATDDLLRQEYHQLLLKFDSQKEMSAAQKKEIEFYRQIISNTSPIEVNRRMDEMEERLRQFCDNLGWFTHEHSRIVRENNRRSQNKFSMRDTLGSLARSLESATALSEENKALKRRLPLKPDMLWVSEEEEFGSTTDSEERVWGGTSTIHRKKGSSNLRSPRVEKHAPHSNGLHEKLEQSQELSNVERLAQVPTSQADLVASLQSRLESAQTHIINLGGNLGALLPWEEVKQDFKSLVEATQVWIRTCVQPAIDSSEQCFQASERAQNNRARDASLGICRARNQDFRTASKFPGADQNIFLVMIFDILIDHIFSTKLQYGNQELQREIDAIQRLGLSVGLNSRSPKSLYNSRRWMSEAMAAILAREEVKAFREDFSTVLTDFIIRAIGLAEILGPNNHAALDAATISIRRDVVVPAFELGTKMACAIDKYLLDVPRYWSEPCDFHNQLFHDLGNLDCKNFGDGPPVFRLEKMQKQFSDDEIKNQLRAICPAIPALVLTEVDDNAWGPPTVLVKQQVWVSWNSKRNSRPQHEEHGFFWFLYH